MLANGRLKVKLRMESQSQMRNDSHEFMFVLVFLPSLPLGSAGKNSYWFFSTLSKTLIPEVTCFVNGDTCSQYGATTIKIGLCILGTELS